MDYYYLFCETCTERFQPLLSTSPDELLCPDWEDEHAGTNNLESLRRFHEKHHGHRLASAKEEPDAA